MNFEEYNIFKNGIIEPGEMNFDKVVQKKKKASYLIGIELEFDADSHRDFQEDFNYGILYPAIKFLNEEVYTCYDGSLDNGLEVVTLPYTKNEITRRYKNFINFFKHVKKSFCSRNPGTMGLHFHVSRKALNQSQWNILWDFVNNEESRFFENISRRKRFVSYDSYYGTSSDAFEFCQFGVKDGKYSAVNMNPDADTVEFRFFAGTVKYNEFFGSLEVIMGLVDTVRKYGTIDSAKFLKFINSSKKYENAAILVTKNAKHFYN